eukprot:287412-Rhodomonas_salina.3
MEYPQTAGNRDLLWGALQPPSTYRAPTLGILPTQAAMLLTSLFYALNSPQHIEKSTVPTGSAP